MAISNVTCIDMLSTATSNDFGSFVCYNDLNEKSTKNPESYSSRIDKSIVATGICSKTGLKIYDYDDLAPFIGDKIGSGGFGEVLELTGKLSGYCLKLHYDIDEAEVTNLLSVQHLAVPKLVGILSDGTSIIMTRHQMTMYDWIRLFPPREELFQALLDLVGSLQDIHAEGFCHNDIKFDNVMVDLVEGGVPKVFLIDLGLMRKFGGDPFPENLFNTPGTGSFYRYWDWFAPKLYRREGCTPQTDAFSLAVNLLRLLDRKLIKVRPAFEKLLQWFSHCYGDEKACSMETLQIALCMEKNGCSSSEMEEWVAATIENSSRENSNTNANNDDVSLPGGEIVKTGDSLEIQALQEMILHHKKELSMARAIINVIEKELVIARNGNSRLIENYVQELEAMYGHHKKEMEIRDEIQSKLNTKISELSKLECEKQKMKHEWVKEKILWESKMQEMQYEWDRQKLEWECKIQQTKHEWEMEKLKWESKMSQMKREWEKEQINWKEEKHNMERNIKRMEEDCKMDIKPIVEDWKKEKSLQLKEETPEESLRPESNWDKTIDDFITYLCKLKMIERRSKRKADGTKTGDARKSGQEVKSQEIPIPIRQMQVVKRKKIPLKERLILRKDKILSIKERVSVKATFCSCYKEFFGNVHQFFVDLFLEILAQFLAHFKILKSPRALLTFDTEDKEEESVENEWREKNQINIQDQVEEQEQTTFIPKETLPKEMEELKREIEYLRYQLVRLQKKMVRREMKKDLEIKRLKWDVKREKRLNNVLMGLEEKRHRRLRRIVQKGCEVVGYNPKVNHEKPENKKRKNKDPNTKEPINKKQKNKALKNEPKNKGPKNEQKNNEQKKEPKNKMCQMKRELEKEQVNWKEEKHNMERNIKRMEEDCKMDIKPIVEDWKKEKSLQLKEETPEESLRPESNWDKTMDDFITYLCKLNKKKRKSKRKADGTKTGDARKSGQEVKSQEIPIRQPIQGRPRKRRSLKEVLILHKDKILSFKERVSVKGTFCSCYKEFFGNVHQFFVDLFLGILAPFLAHFRILKNPRALLTFDTEDKEEESVENEWREKNQINIQDQVEDEEQTTFIPKETLPKEMEELKRENEDLRRENENLKYHQERLQRKMVRREMKKDLEIKRLKWQVKREKRLNNILMGLDEKRHRKLKRKIQKGLYYLGYDLEAKDKKGPENKKRKNQEPINKKQKNKELKNELKNKGPKNKQKNEPKNKGANNELENKELKNERKNKGPKKHQHQSLEEHQQHQHQSLEEHQQHQHQSLEEHQQHQHQSLEEHQQHQHQSLEEHQQHQQHQHQSLKEHQKTQLREHQEPQQQLKNKEQKNKKARNKEPRNEEQKNKEPKHESKNKEHKKKKPKNKEPNHKEPKNKEKNKKQKTKEQINIEPKNKVPKNKKPKSKKLKNREQKYKDQKDKPTLKTKRKIDNKKNQNNKTEGRNKVKKHE
ncbi:trichohyalin-like [Palaemon carinicauda]|uniref:trichohyalin-like n=1 Tax=Palaemon carinicauda TaxID=392227 RepID=UPI0035B5AFC7